MNSMNPHKISYMQETLSYLRDLSKEDKSKSHSPLLTAHKHRDTVYAFFAKRVLR